MATLTPEAKLPLLLNQDVLTGKYSTAFSSHYLLGTDQNGLRIIELVESSAGIAMAPIAGKNVWLKSDFAKLGAPDCDPALKERAAQDFAVSNDDLHNLCTVGCGTNLIFRFSDGLYYAAVERTAPKTTDNGSVNAGLYSRPAGGSTGDIDLSALRELSEEFFMIVKDGDQQKPLHIIPDLYQVDPRAKAATLQTRHDRFPAILAAYNVRGLSLSNSFEITATGLSVPKLTENIIERRTGLTDKTLTSRVFGHAPQQMDVNGVDAVVLVDLAHLSSQDVVGIWDGEENLKDELLKRTWSLMPLDDIHAKLLANEIKMSPVPARVVRAAPDVRKAIDLHLGL